MKLKILVGLLTFFTASQAHDTDSGHGFNQEEQGQRIESSINKKSHHPQQKPQPALQQKIGICRGQSLAKPTFPLPKLPGFKPPRNWLPDPEEREEQRVARQVHGISQQPEPWGDRYVPTRISHPELLDNKPYIDFAKANRLCPLKVSQNSIWAKN